MDVRAKRWQVAGYRQSASGQNLGDVTTTVDAPDIDDAISQFRAMFVLGPGVSLVVICANEED